VQAPRLGPPRASLPTRLAAAHPFGPPPQQENYLRALAGMYLEAEGGRLAPRTSGAHHRPGFGSGVSSFSSPPPCGGGPPLPPLRSSGSGLPELPPELLGAPPPRGAAGAGAAEAAPGPPRAPPARQPSSGSDGSGSEGQQRRVRLATVHRGADALNGACPSSGGGDATPPLPLHGPAASACADPQQPLQPLQPLQPTAAQPRACPRNTPGRSCPCGRQQQAPPQLQPAC
jgi:hypothetical protein